MKHQLRRALYIAASAALATALLPVRAHADTSSSATVTVTATVAPKITISVDTASIAFGSVEPEGTAPSGFTALTQAGTGTYFRYDTPVTVTVKSNKTWNGTVKTDVAPAGVLKYYQGSSAPTTYTDWDSSSTSGLHTFSTTSTSFQDSGSKGTQQYSFYYALRAAWTDDPFTSQTIQITYTATQ